MTNADMPWRIVVSASGDIAEADTLDAALLAAATLVADHVEETAADTRRTRQTVYITRDGHYNGHATGLARNGCRSRAQFERQELEALAARSKRAGR